MNSAVMGCGVATPAAWFVSVENEGRRQRLALGVGRVAVAGTAVGSDLRLRGEGVGERHAAFELVADGVRVTDLGSPTGTWIAGNRVTSLLVSETLTLLVGRCRLKLERRARPEPDGAEFCGMVGDSPAMRGLYDRIRAVAPLKASVLIAGESGSGKDLVARAIHKLAGARGPLVALNVGGLPEALADSELFGHQRGAFTGAVHQREGAFVEASGGTLFLDEVADLSPQVQVKLLRAIENKEVRALGGRGVRVVDCRIISACWADLEERAARGDFRLDLYHRLATVTIEVPPLRARRADIPQLARRLLRRHAEELGPKDLTAAALGHLCAYRWPGNVRELSAVLYRAAATTAGAEIDERHVYEALPRLAKPRRCAAPPAELDVRALLRAHDGNISAAARAAGLPRSTFRSRLGSTLMRGSLAEVLAAGAD